MKKLTFVFTLLIFSFYFSAIALAAEHVDPIAVAGDHYKVLLDNDQVRVLDFTGKAGDKIPAHWHPDHVVYVIKGGKANFTSEGKAAEQDMKTGTALFVPSQNHSVEVIGPGDVHVVIVELKHSGM